MTIIKRKQQSKRLTGGLAILSLVGLISVFFVGMTASRKGKGSDVSPLIGNPILDAKSSRERFYNKSPQKKLQHIRLSEVHLINIDLSSSTFADVSGNKSYNVRGTFCQLDWDQHKSDPSAVPMFKDLIRTSSECKRTTFEYDLWQAVQDAKEYDSSNGASTHAMSPKGLVFHESRCGSTIVPRSM